MRNRMFVALVLVVVAPAAAQAQSLGNASAASAETRKMCREAVLKICDPGFPPDRDAVRRCAARNLDKLPPDCALLLADSAKGSR